MRFNELRYSRKQSLPDYGSEEISLSVFLDEATESKPAEKPSEVLARVKKFILDSLEKPAPKPEAPKAVPQQPVAPKAPAAPSTAKPLAAVTQALQQQIAASAPSKIVEAAKAAGVVAEVQF